MKTKEDKKRLAIFVIKILAFFIIPTIIFFAGIFVLPSKWRIPIVAIYSFLIVALGIYSAFIIKKFLKESLFINRTLSQYIQNEISESGTGIFIFLNSGEIIWATTFILSRFGSSIIGKNINEIFSVKDWNESNYDFAFKKENYEYSIHVNFEKNIVIVKDVTFQTNLLNDYKKQSIVLGELHIDNINLYQVSLPQEDLYKIYSNLALLFDEISKKYNIVYHQYENGQFFIITNKETLDQFEKDNFDVFRDLNVKNLSKQISITLSGGFAYGIYKFSVLDELAKEAILQSKTRGGDQITVLTKNESPRFYGSISEIDVDMSRTNVSYIAKILISKLKSKNITKVIVYGHKNADLDALGSSWAIYKLAKEFGKDAFIQNKTFDETTQKSYNALSPIDKQAFISPSEATSMNDAQTLVVICDTSVENRIENKNAFKNIEKENIIILDHHRLSTNPDFIYKENLYIDSLASSASEIVTEIIAITNNNDKIDNETAQRLLDGIYLDTNNFQKQTSSKTFSAAALLEKWGAKISISVNNLKINEEVFSQVFELLENLEEVKPGYFLAYKDIKVSPDVISIAAEEILRVNGRKAAFVIGGLVGQKKYKLSARGINTNVQLIAEAVNGGGHFSSAAAESDEKIEVFVDNLRQAIVSVGKWK
ncbi:DHH family phosphoesterase [Metamycoplasma auris 15026]|uniref:DHH family phosphoesterase n=1 Tax=Metamycoplasma auris 15026 TaxID=1188233 RepID=N9TQT1_9BACT|nr:DHH family phosphoesterase [Metamycoplasma auris]ENY68509.1 DHH family phosphoesterase [Metamycoplasma auris 15026]